MPIYSGGLGVLAGDHLKSASRPRHPAGRRSASSTTRATSASASTSDGWQHEEYLDVDTGMLPMEPAMHDGVPVTVEIETRTGTHRRARLADRGRPQHALLLDSNVDGNSPEDRELTARLYGGDQRIRIRQELLLGVGGIRALPRWASAGRRAPQRGTQRLRGARARSASRMEDEGIERRRSAAARGRADRLHHAHAGGRRPRPLPAGPDRGASRAAARRARACRTRSFWGWAASTPATTASHSA